MKLTDKDKIIAEIERLKSEYIKHTRNKFCAEWSCGVLDNILSFINTLEVKKVDVENSFDAIVCKNCNNYLKGMDKDAIVKAFETYKDGDKVKIIIKAQKGE